MKAVLLLILCTAVAAPAQMLSSLLQTNVAMGTNRVPIMVYPQQTNGTRTITVANLLSNATLSGSIGIGTNAAQAILHVHRVGSNAAVAVSGLTNAGPAANTNDIAAWLPVSLNGTNFFIRLYK